MKSDRKKNNQQVFESAQQEERNVPKKPQIDPETEKTVNEVFQEAIKHYEPALRKLTNE